MSNSDIKDNTMMLVSDLDTGYTQQLTWAQVQEPLPPEDIVHVLLDIHERGFAELVERQWGHLVTIRRV